MSNLTEFFTFFMFQLSSRWIHEILYFFLLSQKIFANFLQPFYISLTPHSHDDFEIDVPSDGNAKISNFSIKFMEGSLDTEIRARIEIRAKSKTRKSFIQSQENHKNWNFHLEGLHFPILSSLVGSVLVLSLDFEIQDRLWVCDKISVLGRIVAVTTDEFCGS